MQVATNSPAKNMQAELSDNQLNKYAKLLQPTQHASEYNNSRRSRMYSTSVANSALASQATASFGVRARCNAESAFTLEEPAGLSQTASGALTAVCKTYEFTDTSTRAVRNDINNPFQFESHEEPGQTDSESNY